MPAIGAWGDADLDTLLLHIRSGGREAAAEFLRRYEPLIRRRYRHRLGSAMRRLVDSQELMSTISRRFDMFVRSGSVTAASEAELWGLVFKIGNNALADKARIMKRLANVEGPESEVASLCRRRLSEAEHKGADGVEDELHRILSSLTDPMDRELLAQWLGGVELTQMARELGVSPEVVRKRWQRVRQRLREVLEETSD